MPEGDTVWRTARRLHQALAGRVLTRTDFRVPQLAATDLAGATVVDTVSRGKHLLTRIARPDDGDRLTLHTHLKMEGAWRTLKPDQKWPRPAHQARVVLRTDAGTAVGFSLGVVELMPTASESDAVGHLGPDLLGPDWDEAEAVRRLVEQPARPVRDALLDQTRLAGVGNMYAAELCFVSGVHPATAVGEVPDLLRLVRRAHQMLMVNKERAVQSTTGSTRSGEERWVYRRERRPCRRCGTPVAISADALAAPDADVPSSPDRASYWCPRCQPLPT